MNNRKHPITYEATIANAGVIALVHDNGVDPPKQLALWPDYALPFDAADVPISWQVNDAAHLQIVATTEDAGNTSILAASLTAGAA